MELISPKLVIAKDLEDLVPIASNLQRIQILKQMLPPVDEKNTRVSTSNIQIYITLLGAYRQNEDFDEATNIAKIIYKESIKSKNKGLAIQAKYMLICSLLDDGKLYDSKILLDELKTVKSKNFSYLYSAALAKYYGIRNMNKKEIYFFSKTLNLAIKANAIERVRFEILCGLSLAYEKDKQYNRALLIYKDLINSKYGNINFLNEEEKISINYRVAKIYGYLENEGSKKNILKTLVLNSECLNTNHPLRVLISNEYSNI